MVHVRQRILHSPDLRIDQTPVVEGQGITGLVPQHSVEVVHRGVVVVLVVIHQRPVEIGESVGGVQADGLVHVGYRVIVVFPQGIDTSPADVAFRIETVKPYGPVVILQGLCSVAEEKIGSPSVQVSGRILGLLSDIAVEILDGIVELLGQKIGHSPAEIQPVKSGTEFHRPFQILQSLIILSEAAESDCPEMVAVREDRIEPYGSVEVSLRTAQVTKVVLGDAPIEESPAISRVQTRKDVELTDRLRIFPVRKSRAASEIEHVLIVLRI